MSALPRSEQNLAALNGASHKPFETMADALSTTASQGAAKRQRVEPVKPFGEIDTGSARIKEGAPKKTGGKFLVPLIGNEMMPFNLSPTVWNTMPFGFDLSGKFEKPSFLGGPESDKQEGLHIRVAIGEEQAVFLRSLDLAFAVEFSKYEQQPQWSDIVVDSPLLGETHVKLFVPLKGQNLPTLKVVQNGEVLTGAGWDFLQPHLQSAAAFRRAEVKVVAKVQRIWSMSGKAGVTLVVTQLALRPQQKPAEEDAFPDNDLLM